MQSKLFVWDSFFFSFNFNLKGMEVFLVDF